MNIFIDFIQLKGYTLAKEEEYMGKRQEAALETRRKIIEATKNLLSQKNIEDINIEDITTEAKIAKGSFYTHFKRKEDVISAIVLFEYEKAKINALKDKRDVYEQISYYLIESAKIIEKNTLELAQQWIKSVSAPLKGENAGRNKYQFDRQNLIEFLRFLNNAPVEILADMIMDNYYGAVTTWCMNNGEERSLVGSIEHYCQYGLKILISFYQKED